MKPKWHCAIRALVFTILSFSSSAISTRAQSVTVLYNFSARTPSSINSDGNYPVDIIPYQGRFYGVTWLGGDFAGGVIYSVNFNGTGFRTLHSFGDGVDTGRVLRPITITNSVIYGTSEFAGGAGAVFAINTDGSDYRYVHQFSGDDGSRALCELTLDGDTLFGTTAEGGTAPDGSAAFGTVFAVKTDGQDFTVLHTFNQLDDPVAQTNVGGASPQVGLTLDNNILYGGTAAGGKGSGAIFKMNVDGSAFTVLHEFAASSGPQMNADGIWVSGKMLILNGKLYGATEFGGSGGSGVIFSLNTNGSNFKVLHSFPAESAKRETGRVRTLFPVGNRLYGGGMTGGTFGLGALFQVDVPAGTYKTLYTFPALNAQSQNVDGAEPNSRVFVDSSRLYFAAQGGGSGGTGIIGMLQLQIPQPTLDISQSDLGIRILIYGLIGVTYSLEQTQTLPGTDWLPQVDVTVSKTPQPVDLPAPSVPTFWRARVQ